MKTFKSFGFTVKSLDEKNYTVEAIVSTASADRHGEVILPSAFTKHLDLYRTNPILAWSHPLNAMCETPGPEKLIGRAVDIAVKEEGLWCKFKYAVEENETAALCWRMMKGGFLRAFSIGGLPVDSVDSNSPPEKRATLPMELREKLLSGEVSKVYTEIELVEVSHCFVGANRDALVSAALEGDETAVAMLAKSGEGGDIFHRAAILVRSMKMDNQTLKADSQKILAELAEIRKQLAEPVELLLPDDTIEKATPEKTEEPDMDQVLALIGAVAPAILSACQDIAG